MTRKADHADLAHFERLDGFVRELIERLQAARKENASLREQLSERGERVRELEGREGAWNETRAAATASIDSLASQLDQLEAELDRRIDPAKKDAS